MGRWAKRFASWAAASGLSFAALPAAAQAPVPLGAEFQVNTYTTEAQGGPSVAADADGDFVVVWENFSGSSGTDTSYGSIGGQRYASNGSKQGAEFQVNTYTTSWQFNSAVAADADGDFVVVWQSNGSSGTDTDSFSIQGQRYASNGSTQGAQFQVNTYTTNPQGVPSVAADANGNFVVVWMSYGSSGTDSDDTSIQGQRYASDGSTQGVQFQVNTYTLGVQQYPSIAADADGDFVVVWTSNGSSGTDTSYTSIQGQRYASNGSNQGAQFQVNTYTSFRQTFPSVAADADGDFVVVWESAGSFGTDTDFFSIQGQRYASDGSTQGAQFQVNTFAPNDQNRASVAATADGAFEVVWTSLGSNGLDTDSLSVQGQRYASNGSTQGAQFEINTYTTSYQKFPSVAGDANGDFVVVWMSYGSSGTDGDNTSIQGQRFSLPAAIPVPSMSPTTRFALGAALMLLGAAYALRRRA